LTMKARPRQEQAIWIYGINPAREALRAGGVEIREMVVARADHRIQKLLELAKNRGAPIRQETREALSALVGHTHHQGVALRVAEYPYTTIESIIERLPGEREPLAILDSIQDPQNLGAFLRSACFLGAKGVIIPKDRSAAVTGTVIKVAAGATAYLSVVRVTNLVHAIEQLKEAGLWIIALDLHGIQSVYDADLSVPIALVVGSEQKGIRPLVRKHCDLLVKIPRYGPLESLNAATAGAVALSELQRQRAAKQADS